MATAVLLIMLEELRRRGYRRRRIIKNRNNPLELDDSVFVKLFKVNKDLAVFITDKIKEKLTGERIPPLLRVLVALRFFASGNYQKSLGKDLNLRVSQSSVSRSISAVSHAINEVLLPEVIKFPVEEEQNLNKENFYNAFQFPGVIGAIDSMHVAIIKPKSSVTQDHCFMNEEGYYSINVQLISDFNLKIRSISARYPGGVNKAFIWKYSLIREYLESQHQNENNSWLLGDSHYPLEPWLLTPFDNPQPDTQEEIYNVKHAAARNTVNRCITVLKSRFRCLLKNRALSYEPTRAGFIINACAVLHNLCIDHKLPFDELPDYSEDSEESSDAEESICENVAAYQIRQRIASSL